MSAGGKPFVSVCTPTYNRRIFIPQLIKCYQSQDYPKELMEWIVIDDGEESVKDLFKNILGKGSTPNEKPQPDIFIKAAETIECPASQCVVIEDALKGLNAAKAAKMRCIIIRNELNQDIDFSNADLVVSSLTQFAALLDS